MHGLKAHTQTCMYACAASPAASSHAAAGVEEFAFLDRLLQQLPNGSFQLQLFCTKAGEPADSHPAPARAQGETGLPGTAAAFAALAESSAAESNPETSWEQLPHAQGEEQQQQWQIQRIRQQIWDQVQQQQQGLIWIEEQVELQKSEATGEGVVAAVEDGKNSVASLGQGRTQAHRVGVKFGRIEEADLLSAVHMLRAQLEGLGGAVEVFVCGPPVMMEGVVGSLTREGQGGGSEHVHMERWW
jgi:hypothetical protein